MSFTFDDYPRSALLNGGAVLEDEEARGTFYASFGLAYTQAPTGTIGSIEELASCVFRGHELGCHTFGHLRCSVTPISVLVADLQSNARARAAAASGRMRNFAYPFGSANVSSKSTIMSSFDSARANKWGVNRNLIDRGFLLSVPLYSSIGARVWQRFLKDLQRAPGWLIFYTHDVGMNPSRYGCTPAELRRVVKATRRCGAQIMTVDQALASISGPSSKGATL